jgi:uncharacterized protein
MRPGFFNALNFNFTGMQVKRNIVIPGSRQKPIALDLFYNDDGLRKPVVIFVHGFKGFKDWGHFNLLAEASAHAGFAFVKFNFSYNGTTVDNPLEFADLEAFGNNNYITELDDLKLVIDWVTAYPEIKEEINPGKLFLLGHSRGGGIAILKANEDHRIKKVVTWAAVSDFINRNKKRTVETWKKEGVVYTHNARTGQEMPLYRQFYDTLQANKDRLNILRAAKNLKIPFLVIHGTSDEAVDLQDAQQLHHAAKKSKLFIIEGAGHTFGTGHPFIEPELPPHAKLVLCETLSFFKG